MDADSATFECPPHGTRIMWMLGEKEERNAGLLDVEAADIADKGFSGVIITPRAGNLDLRDPAMLDVLEQACLAARSKGLDIWIMADPRLASDSLIAETGEALEVLIINRAPDDPWNGENLNTARIVDGRFLWEMEYPAIRPTHMHQSGGIVYEPVGIERVFAFRRTSDGKAGEIRDVSEAASWTHARDERKVVVHGEVSEGLDGFEVIAFPIFRTNFFDYAGRKSWDLWVDFIHRLLKRIDCIRGICWDEPGFYTESGKFPAGERIAGYFELAHGYNMSDQLARLVLESHDNAHIRIRNDYYRFPNEIIAGSMQRNRSLTLEAASELGFKDTIQNGIHATWHGEFCGLEEMAHGSMDLWRIRPYQTAAFTDVGGAERLNHRGNAPDVIYSLVLARSLARVGPNRGLIYCNLWGASFGTSDVEPPVEIVDYWRDLLDVFGAQWLAHAYGWPGTRFRDLGFGPGYPDHPSWERFKSVNRRSEEASGIFEAGEQISDVLVVFPLESFYSIGHIGGNRIGAKLVELVDRLTRLGYQLDIVSPAWLSDSEMDEGRILLNGCEYNSIVLPYCRVIPEAAWEKVIAALDARVPVIADLPSYDLLDPQGHPLPKPEGCFRFDLTTNAVERIYKSIPPTYELPTGALGNIRRIGGSYRVHLIADRPSGRFGGVFKYSGVEIEIEERTDPLPITLEVSGESANPE